MNGQVRHIIAQLPNLAFLLLFIPTSTNLFSQHNCGILELKLALNKRQANKIVISVIDAGILLESTINNSTWVNKHEIYNNIDDDKNGFIDDIYGWNFQENTNNISNSGLGNWHGTPVNSIINSICNLPHQELINIKLMNLVKGDSINSIVASLAYIYETRKRYNDSNGAQGANIVAVNCSWGKDFLWGDDHPEWCRMYDKLGKEGILCVSSVPNANFDVDIHGDMPSTCVSDFLITVTNTHNNEKVSDAAYGSKSVDLGAPGANTYTLLNTGEYGYFGGTSAAAPYVTGVIGLLYSLPSTSLQHDVKNDPKETALKIKSAILNGVDKTPSLVNSSVSGGKLNAFSSFKILCDYYGEQHLYKNIFSELKVLSVYPNPAKDLLHLEIESNQTQSISITLANIYGHTTTLSQTTILEGIEKIRLNMSKFNSGVYVLSVISSKQKLSEKIIIE